jgi:hypothetical protein
MKNNRRYWYLAPVVLLMIVLIIGSKDKRPSSSVTITESIKQAVDENKSCQTESNISEDETLSANVETLEEETISAIAETPERETVSAGLESEKQTETEKPHAIEGIPEYEYPYLFPVDIVFASDESVKLVSDIYDEIGFEGEFQSGDETVYEFYRKKFALLLDGKVKIYDAEGNESSLYDRYIPKGRLQHQIRAEELYFFDMDGDGLPELCVQGTSGLYICKYDADADRYIEWWGTTNSGCMILGTRKMADTRSGDIDRLWLFDKDGYLECKITFNTLYQSERLYMVSIPDFEERVRDGKIPDFVKQQVVYDRFWHTYYLRVTEEQYEELIKGLYEARKTAEKHQVPFSYFFDSEV